MASISSSEESDGQEAIKRHYGRRNAPSSSSSKTSQLPTITRGVKRPTVESSQARRGKTRASLNALFASGDEDTRPCSTQRTEGSQNIPQRQSSSMPSSLLKYEFDTGDESVLGSRKDSLAATIAYLKECLPHFQKLLDSQFVFKVDIKLDAENVEQLRILPDVWKQCVLDDPDVKKIFIEVKSQPPCFVRRYVAPGGEVLIGSRTRQRKHSDTFEILIAPRSTALERVRVLFPPSRTVQRVLEIVAEIYHLKQDAFDLTLDGQEMLHDTTWVGLNMTRLCETGIPEVSLSLKSQMATNAEANVGQPVKIEVED